jgi:prepilin-type N-terminal cleavage/methylation domain-containing protein
MERKISRQPKRAFTLIELLVVIAVLAILAAMIDFGPSRKTKARAQRVHCVNNLKQVGLAFRIWPANGDRYQMGVTVTNGGTMEWAEGGNAFRHVQVMSNELNTPKILVCPTDSRTPAKDFQILSNSNLSYFIGLDASDTMPQMFLTGDRNITNGLAPERTVLMLPPDRPAGWTDTMHRKQGNVGLADGSVQAFTISMLREALKNTGDTTNRIALPE